jgi:hypothetical protein
MVLLETLHHSMPRNMPRALEELLKSLDETYERLLKGISGGSREYVSRLLHCLTVVTRPLLVEEPAEILAFDFDTGQESTPKSHADCRCPLVDNGGSQVVQFSVKEFSMSNHIATSN